MESNHVLTRYKRAPLTVWVLTFEWITVESNHLSSRYQRGALTVWPLIQVGCGVSHIPQPEGNTWRTNAGENPLHLPLVLVRGVEPRCYDRVMVASSPAESTSIKWFRTESNGRRSRLQRDALPTELRNHKPPAQDRQTFSEATGRTGWWWSLRPESNREDVFTGHTGQP